LSSTPTSGQRSSGSRRGRPIGAVEASISATAVTQTSRFSRIGPERSPGSRFGVRTNSGDRRARPGRRTCVLGFVEREAHAAGLYGVYLTVPLANRAAIEHLLARGFRIDPFYVHVLADDASMRLDRWVHTGPVFII
jgi:hypothetical protein